MADFKDSQVCPASRNRIVAVRQLLDFENGRPQSGVGGKVEDGIREGSDAPAAYLPAAPVVVHGELAGHQACVEIEG
jgi:hypothetical protein